MVALTCRWPLLSLLYASPPPAQVSIYPPCLAFTYTHNLIYLSKWKWIQSWWPVPTDLKGSGTWAVVRSSPEYMLEHYGGNFNDINLLIKKQSFNLKSKNHSWNKHLKMNNKISLLLLYFNGLSPPDSQKNTSEMKWFAVIVSCSMNIHNGVCI